MDKIIKKEIRNTEDSLPTLTESLIKMSLTERLLFLMTYHQVIKHMMFRSNREMNILDIGCGDGLFLQKILDMIPEAWNKFTYVGIDISIYKIHFAKKKTNINLFGTHFLLADAECLPFKSSVFNVSTIIEVIEHLLDPNIFLSELNQVIKPHGKVIITTPNAYGTKERIVTILKTFKFLRGKKTLYRKKHLMIQGKTIPHRDFTYNEITELLLPYFDITKIYSYNFNILYIIIKKILPYRIVARIIWLIENYAPKLPCPCGGNWFILCRKR